ncbi:hypothetical protein I316_07245 [Kwoniella heveanensis BCC8398]|uniref:PIPK domain-containing protein n=1 Tax=Kwoniella heveanensis BCC8398 TaxID=1296120 RepID=A0A1B9GJH0_9TREE|nr:hypothetical protein I316_07245 [Kwoniella heveanensis BCC8398]
MPDPSVTPAASPSKTSPVDPIPPRSTSPPLPPRKNANGLPPTYLRHLKRLLRQWLEQQVKRDDEGGPPLSRRTDLAGGQDRLWSDDQVKALEKALWEGAILPRRIARDGVKGGKGLLELDWAGWSEGVHKRKAAWRHYIDQQQAAEQAEEKLKAETLAKAKSGGSKSRKGSVTEGDSFAKGRLTVPGSPLPPFSSTSTSTSTPSRINTRPPSVASSSKSSTHTPEVPMHTPSRARKADSQEERSSGEGGDEIREWCRKISSLPGFERLSLPKKDEWEVVEDDFPKYGTIQRDLPGAFPQSSSNDYFRNSEGQDRPYLTASSSKTRFSDLGLPTPVSLPETPKVDTEMLKPVFCLYFPPSAIIDSGVSTSTLRLKRDNSLSARSNISVDSNGVANGKKWWSGSGGRWSEMTIGPDHPMEPEPDPEVEFVEGRYVLPSTSNGQGSWRHSLSRRRSRKRKSVLDSFGRSPDSFASVNDENTAVSSDTENEDSKGTETDEANSSTWSGTQRGSKSTTTDSWTTVIAGLDDDMPPTEAGEGITGIVGGTVVIRGVKREEDRKALENILQLLIYTVHSMIMELDLLDTFRVPREPDEPPPPPKQAHGALSVPQSPSKPRGSADLLRKNSLKERGDRTKGFFHRLGKESRTVWEGLLGKRRASDSHEKGPHMLSSPTGHDDHRVQDYEARPITPVTGTFPSGSNDRSSAPASVGDSSAGLPAKSLIPHPTERHLQILSRLEDQIHSITPGLLLPMPPLLLRVREEDSLRRERAKKEIKEGRQTLDGLPRSSPSKLLSPTFGGHSPDPVQGRALAYRLGGDVRAGLGALSSGIDTFEGFIRLQRLETLYCTGTELVNDEGEKETHICQRPTPSTYVFWDELQDISIEQLVKEVKEECEEAPMICSRSGCTASQGDHLRWWVHAGKKVGLKVETVTNQDFEGDDLDVWTKCEECDHASEPRLMTDISKAYSWGKFMELLLYSDNLRPAKLCTHSSTSLTRGIRISNHIISLTVRPVSVLDTRLPKLQVGPNVAKRKLGKEPVTVTLDGLVKKETRNERVEVLRDEVELYFQVAAKQLDSALDKEDEPSKDHLPLQTLSAEIANAKETLLKLLDSTPPSQLNDVRRQFTLQIKTLSPKIAAAHSKTGEDTAAESLDLPTPEYASSGTVFALPGSAVLIREDEPASVIAYTLSSLAYFTELVNTTKSAPTASDDGGTLTKSDQPVSATSASDIWVIDVRRRDTPRDLLSLRTIAKKKSEVAVGQSSKPPMSISLAPNAPSLELSLEQVEGRSQSSDRLGDIVKNISKATAQDPVLGVSTGIASGTSTSTLKSPILAESDTDAMPRVRSPPRGMKRLLSDPEKSAPPSAFRPAPTRSVSNTAIAPATPTSNYLTISTSAGGGGGSAQKEGWGSVTSSFSNSFNQLLKIGSDVGESLGSIRVRGTDRSLSSLIGPMSMMASTDNSLTALDDRPHIQFTYTLGDRLKLGCTVYYATAFDSLRRRCAIDKSIITSLSRTNAWDAQGGKSKAAFFMTQDKRYIVKELVSKWNVSDTHALLEIAPAYFEHLAGTHNKATSLAKIVGFYTVRINDMQTGTKRQLDLLVMENLFYKQTITRSYDLKGIEGRKVTKVKAEGETKADTKGEGTLFDGEWLEGMQKGLVLLQPHAKRILTEAISLDTRFLSSQSIMDYSLLLGLDEGKQELVVGLVDAIGSYNLFKTIESRGKMAINRGKEVTIIPPDQYRERFENALKHYFICFIDGASENGKV